MTPHEAIAEVLKAHVFENDQDFDTWCARALQTLKECGFELVEIPDPRGREAGACPRRGNGPADVLEGQGEGDEGGRQVSFQVKIRRKCEDCNGQGIVVHPDWRDFWAEHNPKDHGFYDRLQDLVCEAGLLNIPEEIDCPDCKGTGWVEKWADFAKPRDILDAVGEFIRKRDGEKKQ